MTYEERIAEIKEMFAELEKLHYEIMHVLRQIILTIP